MENKEKVFADPSLAHDFVIRTAQEAIKLIDSRIMEVKPSQRILLLNRIHAFMYQWNFRLMFQPVEHKLIKEAAENFNAKPDDKEAEKV